MIELITSNLHTILVFVAGAASEYFGAKIVAHLKTLHPGQTLAQDLEAKVTSIVDAKLAEAGITVNSNSKKIG